MAKRSGAPFPPRPKAIATFLSSFFATVPPGGNSLASSAKARVRCTWGAGDGPSCLGQHGIGRVRHCLETSVFDGTEKVPQECPASAFVGQAACLPGEACPGLLGSQVVGAVPGPLVPSAAAPRAPHVRVRRR